MWGQVPDVGTGPKLLPMLIRNLRLDEFRKKDE
jgi:hypothetical protein